MYYLRCSGPFFFKFEKEVLFFNGQSWKLENSQFFRDIHAYTVKPRFYVPRIYVFPAFYVFFIRSQFFRNVVCMFYVFYVFPVLYVFFTQSLEKRKIGVSLYFLKYLFLNQNPPLHRRYTSIKHVLKIWRQSFKTFLRYVHKLEKGYSELSSFF